MTKFEQKAPVAAEQGFANLWQNVCSYIKDPEERKGIEQAYQFAVKKHGSQKRKSGEDYITHPIAVAQILTTLKIDPSSLIAAILHDILEDTDTTFDEIEEVFGSTVAQLVDGLTKISKYQSKFRSSQERMAENFRKMVLAMSKDLRVILIKLADRLHNLRTIDCLEKDKRIRIAQETLDIYAPLAGRLGIYGLKSELEDLCLKQTKYEIYKEISQKVSIKKIERESYIKDVNRILEKELKEYGFKNILVYGRPKHFYSIYKKMVDRQIPFEDIHDLFAFRIIVETVRDCYEALGVIHSIWKPLPGRFKDYIAMPKANFYQSLHTTVVRPQGLPAEIQIRTYDMHEICEYGIAAHWSYKEKSENSQKDELKDWRKFHWFRQIMETQHDVKNPNEFLNAIKVDLFEEEIFVFTPKGDVIPLANGSTALDFAFAVHTDLGVRTTGAKVNGKITPLKTKIRSGDIVDIITSQSQKPSKDWLNFVKTSKAKNKIRSFLRSEQRINSRKIGKNLLEQEFQTHNLNLQHYLDSHQIDHLLKTTKDQSLDDLYLSIGYGKVIPKDILDKLFPTISSQKEHFIESKSNLIAYKTPTGVLVSGLDHVVITFGRCCNPLPGESIVGFITMGRGVSIHRENCVRCLDLDHARYVEVNWSEDASKKDLQYTTYLHVVTQERSGILSEVTSSITLASGNIQKAQVSISPNMTGILDFEIRVSSIEKLNEIVLKIESIKDVLLVERRSLDRVLLKPFIRGRK